LITWSSGIGLAIVEELAGQGAGIVMNGLGDRKEIEMAYSRMHTRDGLRQGRLSSRHPLVTKIIWLQP
jgi:NAD(P)-dependent dehydrogenase (short-subunit alcohol dehydrogenase family)